jgi:hypothetical protein
LRLDPKNCQISARRRQPAFRRWNYLNTNAISLNASGTLCASADNMLEHERAGLPPLLDFKYEILLDARRFDRPANYALLRISEIGDAAGRSASIRTSRP